MIDVGIEEAFHNRLEAVENVLAMRVVARAVHDNVEMRHATRLRQHLDAGIGIDKSGGFSHDNNQNTITGMHEVEHIVFNAGRRVDDQIINVFGEIAKGRDDLAAILRRQVQ